MIFAYPQGHSYKFMFQRPHQLLTSFVKMGHECIFIDTPNSEVEPFTEATEVMKGLTVYPPDTNLSSLDFDILFGSYPKTFLQTLHQTNPEFVIFDSIDEPTEGAFSHWNLGNMYYECLEHANLVTTTAESLYKKAREYLHANIRDESNKVIMAKNGCDFDYFNTLQPKPIEYENIDTSIILYSGAISQWVNLDLIIESAEYYPEYSFVCIGGKYGNDFNYYPDNLYYFGLQPYERVASFIQHSDVCLIPFIPELPEIQACNPIKLWEYMATGTPIVSTDIPEVRHYADYCDTENFISNIKKAINENNSVDFELRKKVAKKNSWDNRAKVILDKIEELK